MFKFYISEDIIKNREMFLFEKFLKQFEIKKHLKNLINLLIILVIK